MRTEVEMKAWLNTPAETASVRSFLEKSGKFLKKTTKRDIYFAKPEAETFAFRLRAMDGKYFVTEKKRKLVGNVEENEELEFEVSDGVAFERLVQQQGYIVFLEKTKVAEMYELQSGVGSSSFAISRRQGYGRQEASEDASELGAGSKELGAQNKGLQPLVLKKPLLAEVVEIPNLGNFLEIEAICENEAEVAAAHQKIQRIFEELDLIENVEKRQYAVLLKA